MFKNDEPIINITRRRADGKIFSRIPVVLRFKPKNHFFPSNLRRAQTTQTNKKKSSRHSRSRERRRKSRKFSKNIHKKAFTYMKSKRIIMLTNSLRLLARIFGNDLDHAGKCSSYQDDRTKFDDDARDRRCAIDHSSPFLFITFGPTTMEPLNALLLNKQTRKMDIVGSASLFSRSMMENRESASRFSLSSVM